MSVSAAESQVPYVALDVRNEPQEQPQAQQSASAAVAQKTDSAASRCMTGCKKLCQRSCDVISFVGGVAGTVGGLAIMTTAAKAAGVTVAPYVGIPIAVLGFVTAKYNWDIIRNWS